MSTPAYRVVVELHGWQETAKQLSQMAREGEWATMPDLITDEMLSEFALIGTWASLPSKIKQKYGDMIDRIGYYLPFVPGEQTEGWAATIQGFRVG